MKTIKGLDEKDLKTAILGALIAHGDAVRSPAAARFLALQKKIEEARRPDVVARKLRD
jgi:hypothetical protein